LGTVNWPFALISPVMVFIVSAPYSHILNSDYQNSDFMQVAFSRSESPKPDSRRKRRFPNQPVNLSTY
jgi:hypothetical protein